jgi:hypothetical protein
MSLVTSALATIGLAGSKKAPRTKPSVIHVDHGSLCKTCKTVATKRPGGICFSCDPNPVEKPKK